MSKPGYIRMRSDGKMHRANWDGKPICKTKGRNLKISSLIQKPDCKRCAREMAKDSCGLD